MAKPTDRTATRQTLDELIDEAIGARQMLPPYGRCRELDMLLRAAIEGVLPAVRDAAGQAVERTRRWYALRHLLEDVDEVLQESLGSGLMSAAIQVGRLAEQCRRLHAEIR
jgi:hypothetical protein